MKKAKKMLAILLIIMMIMPFVTVAPPFALASEESEEDTTPLEESSPEGEGPTGDAPTEDAETSEDGESSEDEKSGEEDTSDKDEKQSTAAPEAELLISQINSIPGLIADGDMYDVTVIGSASINTTLNLNIDPSVTVRWQADISSNISGNINSSYIIGLSGSGRFEVGNCTLVNSGTGGAIRITGAETSVAVNSGGSVLSGRGGYAILVDASDTTIEVNQGGTVISMSDNTNAAIQVNNNYVNTTILVNGGSVCSDLGGYAINDGAGTATVTNNTTIIVSNGGVISAGTSSAIHSTGPGSVSEIRGGVVSNAAPNNANPTIYMNAGDGTNVIVSGGLVQNTATTNISYTIQTTGNVAVSGGEVITAAGRAINLVGMNSTATVSGGAVIATESGTAICTATTPSVIPAVANASVVVTGGVVSAETGYAIRVTGANSSVTVSGGTVSATDGNAINADNTATNSKVTVSGGSVMSITGYAIQSFGTGSTVTVTDEGRGGAGGQVSVQKTGAAISSKGTVTVNGGFVFAYGTSASTAIIAGTYNKPADGAGGQVAVWDQADGKLYEQGTRFDLASDVSEENVLRWYFAPKDGSGIEYNNGSTTGFFPLSAVTVIRDYGLIFDAVTGNLYKNLDGTDALEPFNINHPIPQHARGVTWQGYPGRLELTGFSWSTGAGTALTIVGGNTTLSLTGENMVESTAITGTSVGVKSTDIKVTIEGDGVLTAKGNDNSTGYGFHLGGNGNLTLQGGTIVAQGGHAISRAGASPDADYYRWAYTGEDGQGNEKHDSGVGTRVEDSFIYYETDHHVMLKALIPFSFSVTEQVGGVSDMSDTIGVTISFSEPIKGLTADDIIISGVAEKGSLSGDGDTWMIALDSITTEGTISVQVVHFGNYYVMTTPRAVAVHKGTQTTGGGAGGAEAVSPTAVVLEARKVVLGIGAEFTSGQFSFAVYDADNGLVATGKNDAGGNIKFTTIVYGQTGTYTYRMVETSIDGNNWVTDHREFTVTVRVTERNNALSAAVSYFGGTVPTFYNLFEARDDDGGIIVHDPLFITEHLAYIVGYRDGTVRPQQSMTRAEVATVFNRLLTDEARETSETRQNPYPDVNAGDWFNDAISAMSKMGIMAGYPDGTFRPNDMITRAELAVIVARFARQMHIMPVNNLHFDDVSGHWAATAINYVTSIGWMEGGYAGGTFRPKQDLSRAEFIAVVNRILERVPETVDDLLVDDMVTWPDNMDTSAWYYLAIQEATNAHIPAYKEKPVPGLNFNYEYWVELELTD